MFPKLIIFDRDNTLIDDQIGYLHQAKDLRWISGALDLVKTLETFGIKIAVVTNQAGVAKGFFLEEDIVSFHSEMNNPANANGGIDLFVYCPHHPQGVVREYSIICQCRKPEPGMLIEALEYFQASASDTLLFGNDLTDIQAGRAIGIESILVNVGEIRETVMNRLFAT
jgi:D-glycero-D-manno-heptose 1,7-bisphosphate phosphatase